MAVSEWRLATLVVITLCSNWSFLVTDGWMDNKVSMVDISYLMI